MRNICDSIESKKIDEILINEYAFNEDVLIENAAISILNHIDLTKNSYIIAAGPGNNGADGLALARHLQKLNKDVKIICKENKNINYKICKNLGIPFIDKVKSSDILIDAIFGTGIKGDVTGYYKELIDDINENKDFYIVSIDMVSKGLNSDYLLMLSSYKQEMLNVDIENKVLDIGVNSKFYKKASNKFLVDDEYIKTIRKKRNVFANKGDFGKVSIYARKGAALLAAKASIKCGSGYTFLLSDIETINANLIKNPECINYNLNEEIKTDVICIGPNFGKSKLVEEIIYKNIDKKLIIDADALNYISENKEILKKLGKNTVITPHPLEFARLTGFELDWLLEYPFEALKRFKNDFKGVVLLKGKNTIIYDGENYYIINIGSSKMANAGMGDVLSGMIASYLAQGYDSLNATIYAAYKHADIGKKLSKTKEIINPSDILNEM